MYQPKKHSLRVLLLSAIFLAAIFTGCEHQNSDASEIPIEGAAYHVHRPDGSHKTYLDIVVGPSFSGKLPDDIDSISVTGPNGDLSIGKNDFNYNPQSRDFWIVLPGFPEIGEYTFKLVSGNSSGSSTDTLSIVKTIPIPDFMKKMRFKVFREGSNLFMKTPDGQIVQLFPESENLFFGTFKDIGQCQIRIIRDENGAVKQALRQIGFRTVLLDKVSS